MIGITAAQALEALEHLKTHTFACYQNEGPWDVVQQFIESTLPPPPPKWVPSDTPYSEVNIGGFTLLDEVKLMGRENERLFVVGLHQQHEIIYTNVGDYYNPTDQERHSKENLIFVSHGKPEQEG